MKILFSLLNALVRLFLVSLASPTLRYVNVLASSWGMSWPLIGQYWQSSLFIGRKLHPYLLFLAPDRSRRRKERMISNTVKTIFVLCFCVNHQHAKIGPKPGGSIIKLACPLSFRSFFKKLYIDTRYPHSWHWKSRLWCLWAWIVLTKKVSPGLKLILPTWLLQQGSKITFSFYPCKIEIFHVCMALQRC